MSSDFTNWFTTTFGHPVPEAFNAFLSKHLGGAENGFGPLALMVHKPVEL